MKINDRTGTMPARDPSAEDGVSRRLVLKAVGTGAIALGGLVASRQLGFAQAAAAAPAGTLTVALKSIGDPSYVPAQMTSLAKLIAGGTFGECLLSRNNDGSLGPQLAESWSTSEDGKALTFNLRKGVKFHDGSEFTSADVKFCLEAAGRKDSTNFDVSVWRNALDHIDTPSPYQVVVYLKARDVGIPFRLAGPFFGGQVMLSKGYIEKAGEAAAALNPIGTGPWKFKEFKAGELARFEAVENHWRKTPTFKELVIRQVPEESTRVALALRGEADLVQVGITNAKELKAGGAKLFVDRNTHVLIINLHGQYLPTRPGFDPKVPWAADPADNAAWERARNVRYAMSLAIDRQAIVDTILGGQGEPAVYQFVYPGSIFMKPDWKPVPYDPGKAKQLLTDAGYPNGFSFPFLLAEANAGPGAPEMGQAVAQYWQAIGLQPKLGKADWVADLRPALRDRRFAGRAFTWANSNQAEPVIGHQGGFMSSAESPYGAEYKPLDDLVDKALATGDFDKRKAIEMQMGQMVIDEQLGLPVAWVNSLWGGAKRIKEFPRVPGVNSLYNLEYVTVESV